MNNQNLRNFPNSFKNLCDILKPVATYGIPGDSAEIIDVGNDKFVNFFENEIIKSLVSKGGSSISFFEGNIGSGKSHVSKLIENKSLRHDFAYVWVDLKSMTQIAIYDNVVREIIQQISIKDNGKIIKSFPSILKRKSGFVNNNIDPGIYLPHKGCKSAIEYVLLNKISDETGKFLLDQYLLGMWVSVVCIMC